MAVNEWISRRLGNTANLRPCSHFRHKRKIKRGLGRGKGSPQLWNFSPLRFPSSGRLPCLHSSLFSRLCCNTTAASLTCRKFTKFWMGPEKLASSERSSRSEMRAKWHSQGRRRGRKRKDSWGFRSGPFFLPGSGGIKNEKGYPSF